MKFALLKLLENLSSTQIVDKEFHGGFKRKTGGSGGEEGVGSFSRVRPSKEPHQVKKYSHSPLKYDEGFNIFARYIAEPGKNRMDNIHIPKVYNIKKYTDASGKHIDSYEMERLQSLQTVSKEELEHMWNVYFNTEWSEHTDMSMLLGMLQIVIDNDTSLDLMIKSQELKEAIFIIRGALDYASKKFGDIRAMPDLHADNLMIRRTSSGVQLVFSDPIFTLKNSGTPLW